MSFMRLIFKFAAVLDCTCLRQDNYTLRVTYPDGKLTFWPAAPARLPHSPVTDLNFPVRLKASDHLLRRKKSLCPLEIPTIKAI
ncbi:hypothetical protein SAMN05216404_103261 [Nitrosospira multiformis]|uniref:Uncharacterized protein n=1 Tax=Nitrosospira multiformis TaxID=1231 RepID=A0A1H8F8N2_9PROT|nr:hypothetical protein SAMN05216404_103261 [Nitrosospira multiformis]